MNCTNIPQTDSIQELRESGTECSIMEEVREMRRKISAEFGHDFNRLGAYYQEIQKKIRFSRRLPQGRTSSRECVV